MGQRVDPAVHRADPNEAIARDLSTSIAELVEEALHEASPTLQQLPPNALRAPLRLAFTSALTSVAREQPPGREDHARMTHLLGPWSGTIDGNDFLPALYEDVATTLWQGLNDRGRVVGLDATTIRGLGWIVRGWRDEMTNWAAIEGDPDPIPSQPMESSLPAPEDAVTSTAVAVTAPNDETGRSSEASPALAFVIALASFLFPILGSIAALVVIRRTGKRMGLHTAGRGLLGAGTAVAIISGILWAGVALAAMLVPSQRAETVAVLDLDAGMCFNEADPASNQVDRVERVDCELAHDAEVLGRVPIEMSRRYPGPSQLDPFALRRCTSMSADVLGNSVPTGLFNAQYIPSEVGWRNGSRDIVCAAHRGPNSERLVGTLRD